MVDRHSHPPTPDQLRSIIDYLAADPNPTENEKKEYTSTGFDLREHERRKMALKKHLDNGAEGKGGMPKIKEGPLVVNWDEGSAATSLEGVKEMLARLERESKGKEAKEGGGCVVC